MKEQEADEGVIDSIENAIDLMEGAIEASKYDHSEVLDMVNEQLQSVGAQEVTDEQLFDLEQPPIESLVALADILDLSAGQFHHMTQAVEFDAETLPKKLLGNPKKYLNPKNKFAEELFDHIVQYAHLNEETMLGALEDLSKKADGNGVTVKSIADHLTGRIIPDIATVARLAEVSEYEVYYSGKEMDVTNRREKGTEDIKVAWKNRGSVRAKKIQVDANEIVHAAGIVKDEKEWDQLGENGRGPGWKEDFDVDNLVANHLSDKQIVTMYRAHAGKKVDPAVLKQDIQAIEERCAMIRQSKGQQLPNGEVRQPEINKRQKPFEHPDIIPPI